MNAIAQCFQSASHQFMLNAQPTLLSPKARALVMASSLVLLASLSASPSARADYVWGNGRSDVTSQESQDKKAPAVSQNSISRWGERLGGVVGRVAGSAAVVGTGIGNSQIGRTVQNAVTGMAEEAGRNLGRGAVSPTPEQTTKPAPAVMPDAERDFIDTSGLNAVFAHGQAAQIAATKPNSFNYSHPAFVARDRTMREFDLALRTSSSRGFPITQWTQVRSMLERPLGATPETQLVAQAQQMSERLYRQGGPGYRMPSSSPTTTLQDMSINMQNRNEAAAAAAPQPSF